MGVIKQWWEDLSFVVGGTEKMKFWDGLSVWYVAMQKTWPLDKNSYADRQELYRSLSDLGMEWEGRKLRWKIRRGTW